MLSFYTILLFKASSEFFMHFVNLIKIRSFDLLPEITKHHTKVKSGDLTIMHDRNVMTRRKLFQPPQDEFWGLIS